MFPGVKNIKFCFLFLRFPESAVMEVPYMPDEDLDGFEHYLSYISKYMATFSEAQAKKNFAKHSFETKFLCGQYGDKKYMKDKKTKTKATNPGEPAFLCAIRDPFEYWAVIDEEGNNIRSEMVMEDLKAKPGEVVVKRKYLGCPAWHAQQKSMVRDWNILQ